MANNKLLLTYANSTASATAAQTISNANSYSVIFDEGRKSIWAQGKEYGYSSDTVTYASYVTTGTGKNLVAGTNVTLTNANGSVTISSTYTDTNTTNVSITNSGTAGTNNYVSAVTMTNSGNNENDHKLTITYSALPSLSLAKETGSVTLAHAGTFTYDIVTSASGHQLTYTRVTATLPSETQLSGGASATTGQYVSAVTVSDHTVTVSKANIPVTSVSAGTGSAAAGQYVSAVGVSNSNGAYTITATYSSLPTIGNGTFYVYVGRTQSTSSAQTIGTANQTGNTATYITAEDLGITGVMNFLCTVTEVPTTSSVKINGSTTATTAVKGDVVVNTSTNKEYLHSGATTGNPWVELGDETSFALKSTAISSNGATDGITATLGGTINSPTITLTGSATNATYVSYITTGSGNNLIAGTGISLTNSNGHVTITNSSTNTDEKVTDVANASKAYLLGHPMQASNDTAYSNAAVYMAGGYVYATSGSVASGTTTLVTGGTVNTAITNAINALDASFSYTNTTTSFISYSLTETNGKVTAFTVNHDKLIDEINAKEAVTAAALNNINGYLNASVSSTSSASGITATLGGTVKAPTISLSGSTANTITYVQADTTTGTGVATGLTVTGSGTNPLTYTVKLTYTSLATTSGTAATISSSNNKVLTNISQAANGKITYSYGSLPATAFGNQSISFSASGDVTGTASGTTSLTPTLTIGNGKVTNAKLANSSITIVDKTVALGESMSPADFWGTL